jgi:hypothetical protein
MSVSAESPASKPRCFNCRSAFKVSEVEPGLPCCTGFCRNHYNRAALELAREAAAAKMEAEKKNDP